MHVSNINTKNSSPHRKKKVLLFQLRSLKHPLVSSFLVYTVYQILLDNNVPTRISWIADRLLIVTTDILNGSCWKGPQSLPSSNPPATGRDSTH